MSDNLKNDCNLCCALYGAEARFSPLGEFMHGLRAHHILMMLDTTSCVNCNCEECQFGFSTVIDTKPVTNIERLTLIPISGESAAEFSVRAFILDVLPIIPATYRLRDLISTKSIQDLAIADLSETTLDLHKLHVHRNLGGINIVEGRPAGTGADARLWFDLIGRTLPDNSSAKTFDEFVNRGSSHWISITSPQTTGLLESR